MMAVHSTEADENMRQQIVAIASGWIGTPYLHQSSCKGAGADCLGLVRGVWRELHGDEPEQIPAYSPTWSEVSAREDLWDAARRHFASIALVDAAAGDVLLMRMHPDGPAKHLAVLEGAFAPEATIIHAYSGHHVCRTTLGVALLRRVVAAFRFPAIGGKC